MARPRAEKKREPTAPATGATRRVLPMELRVGDGLTDERGEWQVIGTPYTTRGGKTARVRAQLVAQPSVTEIRSWSAHERVSVRRPGEAEKGDR